MATGCQIYELCEKLKIDAPCTFGKNGSTFIAGYNVYDPKLAMPDDVLF